MKAVFFILLLSIVHERRRNRVWNRMNWNSKKIIINMYSINYSIVNKFLDIVLLVVELVC